MVCKGNLWKIYVYVIHWLMIIMNVYYWTKKKGQIHVSGLVVVHLCWWNGLNFAGLHMFM